MATLYDNIENSFHNGLRNIITTTGVERVDFCVGYFNIRGWNNIAEVVDMLPGGDVVEKGERDKNEMRRRYCRVLVGMQRTGEEDLRVMYGSAKSQHHVMDTREAQASRRKIVESFRRQLMVGIPSESSENAVKKLHAQLQEGRVAVKLFLEFPLYAKLYLAYRPSDKFNKIPAILGSSNLTYSGLVQQGELDIDVGDSDNAEKLAKWFDAGWNARYCLDITKELAEVLDESWASGRHIPPYYIYLKTAYHLSQEARAGVYEYELPDVFKKELFDFQATAVKLAAHHLDKRGGAMIGDVVGLGKTITACAVAKVYEMRNACSTLVLCPANLVKMWSDYVARYDLKADVQSIDKPFDPRGTKFYRLVIIDESHNLRNASGVRYKNIRELIAYQNCKALLLTATPYNKSYVDLSNQLKLFVPADADLGIKPEAYIRSLGGDTAFSEKHGGIFIHSIGAFEKSGESDDWRDLMRLFLIRRTRTFIKNNYAKTDKITKRKYIEMNVGGELKKQFFPDRAPKSMPFKTEEGDQFNLLYSEAMLDMLASLKLPRYGLIRYIDKKKKASEKQKRIIDNLAQAGTRMMGFCRTTFMKRLDSSGVAFLISVYRHLLRNAIYMFALEAGRDVPIGDDGNLPDDYTDEQDMEGSLPGEDESAVGSSDRIVFPDSMDSYRNTASQYYRALLQKGGARISWLPSDFFTPLFAEHLKGDCEVLLKMIRLCGAWKPSQDEKLAALQRLLSDTHKDDKALVFTQFSDTAEYLARQLQKRGLEHVDCVTGKSENPTEKAERFSPISNHVTVAKEHQIRVLVATDVLSEGQNLQDCHIIVNYDLPWAVIRLIQRAGRVDRIGQDAPVVNCYSFFPADGIERIINLRARLNQRIKENAETVGSDEIFFEGNEKNLKALYTEKSGILDNEEDSGDVDLASQAYQIWKSATEANPDLEAEIVKLNNVVYSSKCNNGDKAHEGVITYAKTSDGNDVLMWMDRDLRIVTQSQQKILNALSCSIDEAWVPPLSKHHEIVRRSIESMDETKLRTSGILGSRFSTKFQIWTRLNNLFNQNKGGLFEDADLKYAADAIYNYPLKEAAKNILGSLLRRKESDETIVRTVLDLHESGELVIKNDEALLNRDPQILCTMGLVNADGGFEGRDADDEK